MLFCVGMKAQYPDFWGDGYSANTFFNPITGQYIDTNGDLLPDKSFMSTGDGPKVMLADQSVVSFMFSFVADSQVVKGRIDMTPVGEMSAGVEPGQIDDAPGVDNYYFPWCPDGILDVARFYRVGYKGIQPNVDQEFYSSSSGVRMALICSPGFDPDDMLFKFEGQDSLKFDVDGSVLLYAGDKFIDLKQGIAYQVDESNNMIPLDWGADWEPGGIPGLARLYFDTYDPDLPLIIQVGPTPGMGSDPENLNEGLDWSTSFGDDYMGGNPYGDYMGGSVAGSDGSLYVAGAHEQGGFPPVPGWTIPLVSDNWEVWVGHYFYGPGDPDLDAKPDYVTHFGGAGDEKPKTLLINHDQTALYLGGWTKSATMPAVQPTIDPQDGTYWENTRKGTCDGILARLNPADGTIDRLSLFGGSGKDMITAFAEDEDFNIWFTGVTDSPTGASSSCNSPASDFPLCDPAGTNYWQANNAGGTDAFIARMDNSWHLTYSSFYGGAGDEQGYDIASIKCSPPVIAVVGSSTGTVPQNANGSFHMNGVTDEANGFIATFLYSGLDVWSTNLQKLHGLQAAEDRGGHLLVSGYSHSPYYAIYNEGEPGEPGGSVSNTCTAVPGAVSICDPGGGAYYDDVTWNGDGYLAEFNPNTGALLWSTFVGDIGEELPGLVTFQYVGLFGDPFKYWRLQDLQVDPDFNFYWMSSTTKLEVEDTPYPTQSAAPFYLKEPDPTVGDDQSDLTLHCFLADRTLWWSTLFGSYATHVVDDVWDYGYSYQGTDFGASLCLAPDKALYWTSTQGNDHFPTACPYPGVSYCEPYTNGDVADWEASATRMNVHLINVGISEAQAAQSTHLVQCWPNPANDRVTFTFEGLHIGRARVELFDAAGRCALRADLVDSGLDLGGVAAGAYSARLTAGNGRILGIVPLVKMQ